MSSWTLRFFVRTCFEEWFRISFLFFQKVFDSFFFLFLLCFYFFHKNYYYFTKGKEPAQSPKPAVSLPLNPALLGHGSGLCPKNLPTSKVSSVSYEQICVALFFFKIVFDLFSFLSLLYFYFFIKIITTSSKDRTPLRVRRPRFPVRIFFHALRFILVWRELASPGLALNAAVQSSVALLGVIRCF